MRTVRPTTLRPQTVLHIQANDVTGKYRFVPESGFGKENGDRSQFMTANFYNFSDFELDPLAEFVAGLYAKGSLGAFGACSNSHAAAPTLAT
jgi:hypothetical protein